MSAYRSVDHYLSEVYPFGAVPEFQHLPEDEQIQLVRLHLAEDYEQAALRLEAANLNPVQFFTTQAMREISIDIDGKIEAYNDFITEERSRHIRFHTGFSAYNRQEPNDEDLSYEP